MNESLKSTMPILPCAGLIYIENKKLLLAYSSKKKCFYLPGGKIDNGESALAALCREVREELNVTISEGDLQFYTHISAPAYGESEGTLMEQDCFILTKKMKPTASAEITLLHYFSIPAYKKEINQAPGALLVLTQLQKDGFII